MGDFAVSDPAFSSFEDLRSSAPENAIPPHVLARWAAMASARAWSGVVPAQVRSTH